MNNIIINNNNLTNYRDNNICISDKKIIFNKDGEYTLEYVDSSEINLDIEVMDNVHINLFVISTDNELKVNNTYKLRKNSVIDVYKFYYNDSVKEDLVVNLDGEGTKFNYHFSSISRDNEEYHIIVNHNNHKVNSNVINKCICLDNSKIVMTIDSVLDKGNIDCVMDQTSRILTLGDADSTIRPNMFINEDSVEARHGSVVGRLDEEEIFYLMSRGIELDEAINLIIKGFIFSNLNVDMEKRGRIFQVIQNLRR